jgi:two-component system, cell cycle response regulator DivK
VWNENRAERRNGRRQPPHRPLVLIVAGDADTRDTYRMALASFGFEIDAIADVASTYVRAWQTHPDAIATEISEGEATWNVIQDLKRTPRTRDIPVVVVTSQDYPDVREQAAREGCSAFLLKPFLPDELAMTLRNVIGSQSRDGVPAAR